MSGSGSRRHVYDGRPVASPPSSRSGETNRPAGASAERSENLFRRALIPLLSAAHAAPPPTDLVLGDLQAGLLAVATLLASGFFAVFRRALQRSFPARVVAPLEETSPARARLEHLLDRAESLATSASALKLTADLGFVLLALALLAGAEERLTGLVLLQVLFVTVPLLLLFGELAPTMVERRFGDALLRALLPSFHMLQLPLQALVQPLNMARRLIARGLGVNEEPADTRRIVEDLRGVVAESEIRGDLADEAREIIENVMEFHDADVAEIMTPRTELDAVEASEGLDVAMRLIRERGHSRIPVYEGSLDHIIGVISARDLVQHLSEEQEKPATLAELCHPVHFVPETKLASALLTEFKGVKTKIAIVLDEYGGTAGIVTMGDVLAEIVGSWRDEFDADEPAPFLRLEGGGAEVVATEHVSDVNEELGLELPEGEDFETLAGFVLSELGRFPAVGESFVRDGHQFTIVEASDRRVIRVSIRPLSRSA